MNLKPISKNAVDLLLEGTICLSEIETNGIKVDSALLQENIKNAEYEVKSLREKLTTYEEYRIWKRMYGSSMNLASRSQCGFVLFDNLMDNNGKNISQKGNMGYKCEIFTPQGRPEVSEESLQMIQSNFGRDYVRYLSLQKVLTTYLYSIFDELDSHDFLHPSFNLGGVQTYRSSCLAKGTQVAIDCTGSYTLITKPIENIKKGDYILCYDDNLHLTRRPVVWAGKTGHKKVIRIAFRVVTPQGYHFYSVDLTPEHKIRMSNGDYVEARAFYNNCEELKKHEILNFGLYKEKIEFYKIWELNTVDVYDIQVEDYHNFIANEICVHNSDSPNFQNMPVRDKELAQLVRSCIIPRSPKNHIVEVDYSGAEVKCAAAYHKDSRMLEYLSDNTTDMHRDMAAQCFMLPPEKITKPMRNISKGYFVFASFYGSWWVSLAMNIWRHLQIDNVTTEDGVLVIDHLKSQGITGLGEVIDGKPTPNSFYAHIKDVEFDFWNNRFSEYNQWKKQAWNNYLKNGYIDFLSGFRCAGVFSRNEVLNMPIQGLSFHCLLWSLIQVNNELKKRKMKTLLIGQIHDSIVADSPENETDRFLELVHEMMVERLHKHWKFLVARMEVEADVAPLGCSWFDKKPYAITK